MTREEILAAVRERRILAGADLEGANLEGANLIGANLNRANLGGANLGCAYLSRANLGDQWIVTGPQRSDGYSFLLMRLTGESAPRVRAGCRWLAMPEAREHWRTTRDGTPLGDETQAILDYLERVAQIRGLS